MASHLMASEHDQAIAVIMTRHVCQCSVPEAKDGWVWCERHKTKKTAHWVRLCQTRLDYWQAWEEGRGPGQAHEPLPKTEPPRRPVPGPGTELKRILLRFGIKARCGCDCARMARQMNNWGPDGCEIHLAKIVDHLEKEAKRRKVPIPFRRTLARLLVRRAIRRARKKETAA